ncbi:MAG: VIT1/CCC1 transporter family protein [Nitriliruptorales bacterium]
MAARSGVQRVLRATEMMRLKTAGVALEERLRQATRNGALRAAVFGVNDGLVSNLALIMGVAGANVGRDLILLTGLAGLLAGAFSMGVGEYLSMRVQREVAEKALTTEQAEIARDPEGERRELAAIYQRRGFSTELAERMAAEAMADPLLALEAHARDELSIDDQALGSPMAAALSSLGTFSLGASIPLLPYLFTSGSWGLGLSVVLSLVALATVGAQTALLAGRPRVTGALRMLTLGSGAAALTFAIGSALGVQAG